MRNIILAVLLACILWLVGWFIYRRRRRPPLWIQHVPPRGVVLIQGDGTRVLFTAPREQPAQPDLALGSALCHAMYVRRAGMHPFGLDTQVVVNQREV